MSTAPQDVHSDHPPVEVSRWYDAPRELVFSAWCSADHVRNWFAPEHFSIPEVVVEAHPGGRFELCMEGPGGMRHWSRGGFDEVARPERLAFHFAVTGDGSDTPIFTAHTLVTFAEDRGGTRLDVSQHYAFADPAMATPLLSGAPMGWKQTLDKLEREVARMRAG